MAHLSGTATALPTMDPVLGMTTAISVSPFADHCAQLCSLTMLELLKHKQVLLTVTNFAKMIENVG